MEQEKELFWQCSIEELKRGYVEREEAFVCIICGKAFTRGEIFKGEDRLYDAKRAVRLHIEETHDSMLSYILQMNGSFVGITQIQREMIKMFAGHHTDQEISQQYGITASTIRNHRYKLREKEKQARVFIALMELLSETTKKKISSLGKESICDPIKTAAAVDDRFNITEEEKEKIRNTYFSGEGALKNFPAKEKRKIVILEKIAENYKKGQKYSEKEIDRILKRIYEDYAALRRALIEYGYLDRSKDGSAYWVRE